VSLFRSFEARIENLVEGVFSRAFSSEVQPVELARKLAKEMDSHKTASVSRVYVPNEYTVHLSPADREKLEGYERSLGQELSGYLLEHARTRGYDLLTRPEVKFNTDDRLRLGEFGIQTRLVKTAARKGERPQQAEEGETMIYTVPAKKSPPPPAPAEPTRRLPGAFIEASGRRIPVPGSRAVIGRSDEADCVLPDPNISRRHAELRQTPDGEWEIVDLNSTNGIKVNDHRLPSARLRDGDRVTLGTTSFRFGLER
jgi:hypothetical protein